MTTEEVLKHNAFRLKDILDQELKLEKQRLLDEFHHKTLVQIFVENRIYKDIEEQTSYEDVQKAVLKGVNRFKKRLRREVTMDDVEMLLGIRIKKISRFDIDKSKKEIGDILKALDEVEKELKQLTRYTVRYIKALIAKYKDEYPRRTRIDTFESIDVKEVIASSLKVCYDKANGYLGHSVRGDSLFNCTALDKIVIVWKDGRYMVAPVPDKQFVNKDMVYCALYDRDRVFTMVYTAGPVSFCKRFKFGGTIMNKEYRLSPDKSRIQLFTDEPVDKIYVKYKPAPRQRVNQQVFKAEDFSIKGAKAKGNQLTVKKIANIWPHQPRGWDGEADEDPDAVLDI